MLPSLSLQARGLSAWVGPCLGPVSTPLCSEQEMAGAMKMKANQAGLFCFIPGAFHVLQRSLYTTFMSDDNLLGKGPEHVSGSYSSSPSPPAPTPPSLIPCPHTGWGPARFVLSSKLVASHVLELVRAEEGVVWKSRCCEWRDCESRCEWCPS